MKAFALTWDGVYRNLMVATAPDLLAAKAAVDGARADGGVAVATDADLELSGPALIGLYNALAALTAVKRSDVEPPVAVTRFATRGDGQKRIFALLESSFKDAPETAAPPKADITSATTTETINNEDDMATKGKKTKAAKPKKAPRVKKEKVAGAGTDDFGLRKGSKNSQAAAMFARASGATMAKVKEAVGDTFYGMLGKLEDAGHKVKKDGKTIFLTAK